MFCVCANVQTFLKKITTTAKKVRQQCFFPRPEARGVEGLLSTSYQVSPLTKFDCVWLRGRSVILLFSQTVCFALYVSELSQVLLTVPRGFQDLWPSSGELRGSCCQKATWHGKKKNSFYWLIITDLGQLPFVFKDSGVQESKVAFSSSPLASSSVTPLDALVIIDSCITPSAVFT